MRYYAQYENNTLIAIGTGNGGIEIAEAEYKALLAEICAKASLVDKLYNNEIVISDIPTEWQEEIRRRVDERIVREQKIDEEYISSDEV